MWGNMGKQATRIWRILGEEEIRVMEDNPGWDLHVRARRVFATHPTEARQCCDKSLELAQELKKPIGTGLAHMNLGTLALYQDDPRSAVVSYENSALIFKDANEKRLYGVALMCLGIAQLESYAEVGEGDWGEILSCLKRSEAILRQEGGGGLLIEVNDVLRHAMKTYDGFLSKGRPDTQEAEKPKTARRPKEALHSKISLFPVVGRVAAGQPIFAEHNIEGYLDTAEVEINDQAYTVHSLESGGFVRLRPAARHFVLVVKGSSMIDVGILDGDYVLVREQKKVEQGEIAIVQVTDLETEATLKRYYRERDHIRLQPENNDMDPIIIPEENATSVVILGKPIAVLKKTHVAESV